jgi:voltage-gated potassium channel
MSRLKRRIYTLLEPGETGDWASKATDLFLIALILANAFVSIAVTMPGVWSAYRAGLFWFEAVSVGIFTMEYLLRVWSCTAGGASPLVGRLRFMLRPLLLIDLIAILPFFLYFLGLDLRMARVVRIVRFVRIAKLGRYSTALRMLGQAVWERKEELALALLLGAFALVLSASLIYFAENEAQPEVFPSIPSAFWWAITTLTTVGYGDAYPVTVAGKIFGGLAQVIGVGLFAMPTGILAASFMEQFESRKAAEPPRTCPHCGRPLEE